MGMKEITVHVHNGIDYPLNTDGRCGWHLCSHMVYNSFDDPEEIKVMRIITLNEDDMGCDHNELFRATCGHCHRNWCAKCKPTPSARCPYEYEHDEVLPDVDDFPPRRIPLAPHGGCNWRGCRECFPDEKTRNRMEQEEIQRAIKFLTDYGFTVTKADENNDS